MKSLRVAMFVQQIEIRCLLFGLVTSKEKVYVETDLPSSAFSVIMRSEFNVLLFAGTICAIHAIGLTVKCTFHCYLLAFLVANSSHF